MITLHSDAQRGRLLLLALVLSHLLIITRQVDAGGGLSLLEASVLNVLSPLQRAVAAIFSTVGAVADGYVNLRHVREDNQRLAERLRAVEIELSETRQMAQEAGRLRTLLDLRASLPLQTTVGEVIATEGVPWASMITINKGSGQGLALNAPVISPTGVLGRVIALGHSAAKVQLIIDRDAGVGVLIERSRTRGVLGGQRPETLSAQGELPLKYIPALADVVVGDAVVTSGLDQIFPKGLMVGHVSRVQAGTALLKEVWVTPSARFDQLEEVLVLPKLDETPSFPSTVQ